MEKWHQTWSIHLIMIQNDICLCNFSNELFNNFASMREYFTSALAEAEDTDSNNFHFYPVQHHFLGKLQSNEFFTKP